MIMFPLRQLLADAERFSCPQITQGGGAPGIPARGPDFFQCQGTMQQMQCKSYAQPGTVQTMSARDTELCIDCGMGHLNNHEPNSAPPQPSSLQACKPLEHKTGLLLLTLGCALLTLGCRRQCSTAAPTRSPASATPTRTPAPRSSSATASTSHRTAPTTRPSARCARTARTACVRGTTQ